MLSFCFMAWDTPKNSMKVSINKLLFCCFFNFLDSLSKPNSTYMNIYVKSHNIVGYSFIEWIGGEKSPLICSIFKPHLQAEPKVYKSQSGIGLMYGTYILRIWKKTCAAYHTFFYLTFNFNKKLHTFTWDKKVF